MTFEDDKKHNTTVSRKTGMIEPFCGKEGVNIGRIHDDKGKINPAPQATLFPAKSSISNQIFQ